MKWIPISVVILTFIFIAIALGPSLTPFDAYNSYWDGYSTAASICLKPVYALPSNLSGITSIFITPETNLSRSLISSLLNYVVGGGRLVVIDGNVEASNQLLSELGVGSRFTNLMIRDPILNVINEEFPLAFVVSNPLISMNQGVLALDNATVIDIGDPNAVVIAETSRFSIAGNLTGSFPVIVAISIGRGYVILISSPGMLMNSLINEANNEAFLRELCSNGSAVYFEGALIENPQGIAKAWLLTAYAYASTYPVNYLLILAPVILMIVVLLIKR